MTTLAHISPTEWNHAQAIARQACARIFRDGGAPRDALAAFSISNSQRHTLDWSRAVDVIADALCSQSGRKAA